MLIIEPDFFREFSCTANLCRHSCCVGWEIDIDEDTARYYCSVTGSVGEKLRSSISFDDCPHFLLSGREERCPFLQPDGLCELVLQLGEDSLCEICREHPRFYHCLPGREERGLGLCCEEAVRLLLSGTGPLRFLCSGTREVPDSPLIVLRDKVLQLLADGSCSWEQRIESACSLAGTRLLPFSVSLWKDFYLSLERLDECWTAALQGLEDRQIPGNTAMERIAEYFVFRHMASAETEEEAKLLLQFSFLSTRMIFSVDAPLADAVRMYSSEIEYSDENIDRILVRIRELLHEMKSPEVPHIV